MSEEEKKAIDYYTINEYSFGFEIDCDIESFKKAIGIEETDEDTFEKHQIRFKTLLNLIEKQQEKIENLKKINKEHQKLNGELREQLEICQSDLEEMTVANNHKKENWVHKDILNSYISKDKIREKIKDLEDNMILFTNDKEKFNRYKYARDILEKLLKEE